MKKYLEPTVSWTLPRPPSALVGVGEKIKKLLWKFYVILCYICRAKASVDQRLHFPEKSNGLKQNEKTANEKSQRVYVGETSTDDGGLLRVLLGDDSVCDRQPDTSLRSSTL